MESGCEKSSSRFGCCDLGLRVGVSFVTGLYGEGKGPIDRRGEDPRFVFIGERERGSGKTVMLFLEPVNSKGSGYEPIKSVAGQ